jgi:urease accessory protein
MRHRFLRLPAVLSLISFWLSLPALAHHLPPGMEEVDEFSDGASFLVGMNHPLSGFDHVLAALLVGAVAARFGRAGRILLPAASLGGLLAGAIMPRLPAGEAVLAISVLGAAGLVFLRSARALPAGVVMLVLFQVWHGNVHAAEAPGSVARALYVTGAGAATLLCMILGLAVTLLIRSWMPVPEEKVQTA